MARVETDDLTDDLFKDICDYIYMQARITLGENKKDLVRNRFGKVMRQRGLSSYHDFFKWVRNDTTGDALREVMNAISTNLTSFFRENDHFVQLAKVVIPEVEKRGPGPNGKIRLRGWSAGCSTGEEVYTMTIVIRETIRNPEKWDIKLLASDLDTNVVAHGHRGLYGKDRLQGIAHSIITRYFTPTLGPDGKEAFQIKEENRRMVAFRHLNLFSDWPFKHKFNYIFCRNVMIYFDKPTQQGLINRYYDALEPGGFMFIGHSENLNDIKHKFQYFKPTVYRKPFDDK